MRMRVTLGLALWGGLLASAGRADDKPGPVLLNKVRDALKLPPAALTETKSLAILTDLPPAKAKALAPVLEKAFTIAYAACDFPNDAAPWEDRLDLYLLTSRADYEKAVALTSERAVLSTEAGTFDNSGDRPFVMVTVSRGEGPGALEARAITKMATVLLEERTGVDNLSPWVRDGFAKAIAARSGYRGAAADRAAMKRLAKAAPLQSLWAETPPEGTDYVAAGFMDYLAFGPPKAKWLDFARAYVSGDDAAKPDWPMSLEAAGLTPKSAEAGYRTWVRGLR